MLSTNRAFFEINPDNPAIASDPEIYKLRNLNFTDGIVNEDVYELSADLRYDTKIGEASTFLKFGAAFRDIRWVKGRN